LSKQAQTETTTTAGGNLYERELDAAISLARAAGAAALEPYGGPLSIVHKSVNDDPVTQADHAANDVIVAGLQRQFPADGLLSEETLDTVRRLSISRVWMIDPLDGTKGFIDGNGDFAVQIGLVEDGTPVLGVVYQPVPGVLQYAARGTGAWVVRPETEPERMRVSDETEFARMRMATSRDHHSPRMSTVMRVLGLSEEVRRGSVGIKTGLIAERQCHLYVHLSPRTKHWDTCAPEAILTEAGGRLTDLWGEPLRYNTEDVQNRNGLLAAGGAAHPLVVSRLTPLLDEFGRTRVS
jgi:3'(2'), 5'-bisphosphate nucleotidase